MSFLPAVLFLSGAFLTIAVLERIPELRFAPSRFLRPYLLTDGAWYLVATGASAVSVFVFRPQLARLALPGAATRAASLPGPARLFAAVVLYDLVAFLVHVTIHRSETLWEVHKVHHSSLRLDWLATTRTHLAEHLVRNVPAQAALFAFGLPAPAVAMATATYAMFALLGHSNLELPTRWAERVFVTPRLHRIHHVPATSTRNFGTVFSVWDRLAGTLVLADTVPETPLGVPGQIDSYPQRFDRAIGEPFRRLPRRRARAVAGAS